MPNIVDPTIPNFPPQGIQAQLDLLYLYNPNVAQKLIDQLNAGLIKMEELEKELEKALQDLQGVLRYKGSVETEADLPTEGNVIGDVWNITSTDENVAWNGTSWDKFGSGIDVSVFLTKTDAANTYATKQEVASVLPEQTGNAGKFLTTNGTEVAWEAINAGVTSVNTKTGDVVLTGADINATLTGTGAPVTTTVTEHLQTLKNDETELGNQVSNIQALIPSDASETNLLATKADIPAPELPTQEGNAGKFLTTDGTSASWAEVQGGVSEVVHDDTLTGTGTTDSPLSLSDTISKPNGLTIERTNVEGPILYLKSAEVSTNFILERTHGAQCVLEAGSSVGLFGTKTDHPLQIRTNYQTQMTINADGSVILDKDVRADSDSNQVATTKWVNDKFEARPAAIIREW